WRLTGVLCSEVTSLGCHTDMWAPWKGTFSSLAHKMNWIARMPNMVSADTLVGNVKADICNATGLPDTCQVSAGIHDSNASYLRYLTAYKEQLFTVVSTGTWSISMAPGAATGTLLE